MNKLDCWMAAILSAALLILIGMFLLHDYGVEILRLEAGIAPMPETIWRMLP